MKIIISILFIFLVSCKTNTDYPLGGFDYPQNIADADTNYYHYPLKDIEPKRDAFKDTYAYLFYRPFEEPNLSIKALETETFRLTYSDAFGNFIIITLTEELLVVKQGSPTTLYDDNTTNLSDIEKLHLRLLQKHFPIDTAGKPPLKKHYLDSLVKLYPELLNSAYYHKVYQKSFVRNSEAFNYSASTINLKKGQYKSIVEEINSSGFWSLPYQLECKKHDDADGYSFTLEVNTKLKYKIVSALSCTEITKFTKVCQRIIDLAKMDKEVNLDTVLESEPVLVDSIEI